MANVRKPTKIDRYNEIKAIPGISAELVAFCDHEIELLEKRNSAEKKLTPVQQANEGYKNEIVAGMAKDTSYTISELTKLIPSCANFTPQRMNALLMQMLPAPKGDGRILRSEVKGKAYFMRAD